MAFDAPKLGKQAAVRIDDQMRKDLMILMAARGGTVSDILRGAVKREADGVRQAWLAAEVDGAGDGYRVAMGGMADG